MFFLKDTGAGTSALQISGGFKHSKTDASAALLDFGGNNK